MEMRASGIERALRGLAPPSQRDRGSQEAKETVCSDRIPSLRRPLEATDSGAHPGLAYLARIIHEQSCFVNNAPAGTASAAPAGCGRPLPGPAQGETRTGTPKA